MKIMRCSSATGNASWAVGYLLRKEETGIIETTEIMHDSAFREAIQLLLEEHQQQFEATEATHYQNMAASDFQPSGSKKVQQNRDRIKRHHDLLEQRSGNFKWGGRDEIRDLAKLIHDADLTMQYKTEGKHFKMIMEPIPLPEADDPDAVEKVMNALKAVRDIFPTTLPAVFTIHTKGDRTPVSIEDAVRLRKNIHIQGLISTKTFEDRKWSSPYEPVAPKKGDDHRISDLAEQVENAVTEAIGKSFTKHSQVIIDDTGTRTRVPIDPDRPKRDQFTKAAAAIIGRHTNAQLRNLPLESIADAFVRNEIRQVLAIDRYDQDKAAETIRPRPANSFDKMLSEYESHTGVFSIAVSKPVPTSTDKFSVLIDEYEQRRDYAAAVRQQILLLSQQAKSGVPPEQSETKPQRDVTRNQSITGKHRQIETAKPQKAMELVPDRRSKEGRDAEILKLAMKQAESQSSQRKSKISFLR
ncbi:MAG: hypothetical protein WCP20_04585 [Desulfuromonadales bacterium]